MTSIQNSFHVNTHKIKWENCNLTPTHIHQAFALVLSLCFASAVKYQEHRGVRLFAKAPHARRCTGASVALLCNYPTNGLPHSAANEGGDLSWSCRAHITIASSIAPNELCTKLRCNLFVCAKFTAPQRADAAPRDKQFSCTKTKIYVRGIFFCNVWFFSHDFHGKFGSHALHFN